jgi:hypothetical protein
MPNTLIHAQHQDWATMEPKGIYEAGTASMEQRHMPKAVIVMVPNPRINRLAHFDHIRCARNSHAPSG